jgi:hypothetical protein
VQAGTPCGTCDQVYKVALVLCGAIAGTPNPASKVAAAVCALAATYAYMNCIMQNCGTQSGGGGGSTCDDIIEPCPSATDPPPDDSL